MTNHREQEPNCDAASCSGTRFTVQPERELQANWEVDLANKLEDYLLKICSGQIYDSEHLIPPVNFAEAALLVQGSVQVYSRKVEYLYNLVLHALEFLSQKSQQDQSKETSVPIEGRESHAVSDEENDLFWCLDDIPVEAKNRLDSPNGNDNFFNHFVKPPANLIVLEGDCLDSLGDGTELESYLLATSDLYRDFILLDPCDAVAVNDFLEGGQVGKGHNGAYRGSASRKSFQSPTRCSGGTANKPSIRKKKDANLNPSPSLNMGHDPPAFDDVGESNHEFDMEDRYSEPRNLDSNSDEEEEDPWKPLNPHEPGNLKVIPFKKVKAFRRNAVNSTKQHSVTTLFPLAKLHGTISPELTQIWEARQKASEKQQAFHSSPLYEKLRQSLANKGQQAFSAFGHPDNFNEDKGYDSGDPDSEHPDIDMPESMYMDEDVLHFDKHDDGTTHCEINETFEHEVQDCHANLEDLCRSHLDALLASIAETEKLTELAARVSSWKQKIEHNLDEQDSCPPFDIHEYGESIIDKLSLEGDHENVTSFTDVVKGQEKYDVARTFSALLQLVNNGDVALDRSGIDGESICYTAVNPFHVRLLRHDKRQKETQYQLSKKRAKSPSRRFSKDDKGKSMREKSPVVNPSTEHGSSGLPSQPNCKFSVKLGGARCTPEGKKRRRSRLFEPADLHTSS
ncbi:condensin-2 complex subunit H2-like isoform X2 [Mangifera indica]|uniref:condensin-2 complex subunit H2-like isoform X2 n=1 Tax=Mangifera indica TaxID=29780 RepID=UPI001CFC02B3|nr:condensin-2 complex subunit H2-like isoform X2 [Mangifera indica]